MSFQDKSIQCYDCGATFTFSVTEQEEFASKGHTNDPKRCPSCRQARKVRQQTSGINRGGDMYGYRAKRRMFPTKCSGCGKDTEVPFEPRSGRPVYCSDCYRKVRLAG